MPPFNPVNFFEVAEAVSSKPNPSEAELRTSVGRAYYASFLVARDRLCEINVLPEWGRDFDKIHDKVIEKVSSVKSGLGNNLRNLRRLRTQADYVLSEEYPNYRHEYASWTQNWENANRLSSNLITHLPTLSPPRR